MGKVPREFNECVHTEDFSGYKAAHREEHKTIDRRLSEGDVRFTALETKLGSMVTLTKLILGAVVSGLVSIVVILLTRGI